MKGDKGKNEFSDEKSPKSLSQCGLRDFSILPVRLKYQGEEFKQRYKEFAKFMKNKKIFKFSSPSICGVPFDWRNIDKTKHLPPITKPNLDNIQTTGYYVVKSHRYWHIVYQFLPDKMLKHYGYCNLDYKKFKIWLCFLSGIDWFNFYRYTKENLDADLFSIKRKSNEIPPLVLKLIKSYEEFLSNVAMLEYKDPFMYKSCSQLIEEYEGREEIKEMKFKWCNGKLEFE